MEIFKLTLLVFLIVCALAASLFKNQLIAIIVFMAYSLVMSIIWFLLASPDLAITEAAVGAGVSSILFFVTLRKIKRLSEEEKDE
ncbi:MAG: DUF4040 domain-containing protein [Lachnospiraceae bacterium]|nr:DUF4040 domain-containing protein [Lachnospiraceae bacterium]